MIVPETSAAQNCCDKSFYRRKGIKHAAETLVAYHSMRGACSLVPGLLVVFFFLKTLVFQGRDELQVAKAQKGGQLASASLRKTLLLIGAA